MKRGNVKNVTFYVMSSNDAAGVSAGQFWTSVEEFPKPVMTKYYLHGDGSVSTKKPSNADGLSQSTSYVFDPANPQKTQGGNNLWSDAPCGPLDQAAIDTRADVIVFQTPVMTEELPLTGAINGHLYVSSDAVDTDFMVSRLCGKRLRFAFLRIFFLIAPVFALFRCACLMCTPPARRASSRTAPCVCAGGRAE